MRTPTISLALVLMLTACGGGAESSSSRPTGTDALGEGEWALTSATVDGAALTIMVSHPVTISLTEQGVGGRAACNSYFGTIENDGAGITIRDIGSTMMACAEPGVMELEAAYLAALQRVSDATTEGGSLVLTGDGVTLTFAPVVPAPDADLEGTEWLLETLVDGDTASSTVAGSASTLTFVDGTVSGSTGCNTFRGTGTFSDGRLLIGELATTKMGCRQELLGQEQAVLAVLGDGPTVEIEGQTLTLSAGERGLVYRTGS